MTPYGQSLSLLTDLYQLTMAYGYWKSGMAEHEAVFHLHFRKHPFSGGYTVACGLERAQRFLEELRFRDDDLSYLASLTGNDGQPLFESGFLDHLRASELAVDVDAVSEGTVVFPHEPLVRVKGPLIQCQLLETALLNIVNFETLIATKAARVCSAAAGDPVLEFGLWRAQGIDGALAASRAAYVGGCAATSNVLAGKLFGIPVKGTHAHSWVMSFDSEHEAFERYAEAMPNNCVFLVDTYDTLEGVRRAVEVGRTLRERNHEMVGIRLDSGDLAWLSIEARKILDEAGFESAAIVASNDLDERLIQSLKAQGAQIAVWGVGTKLATAFDQPALGGVYKLSAIRAPAGDWQPRIKLSEQRIKVSVPGCLQVRRFSRGGELVGDAIWDEHAAPKGVITIVDPGDSTRRRTFGEELESVELLSPMLRAGRPVREPQPLDSARERARQQLDALNFTIKRFDNPHEYPVGLEAGLYARRHELIEAARAGERS